MACIPFFCAYVLRDKTKDKYCVIFSDAIFQIQMNSKARTQEEQTVRLGYEKHERVDSIVLGFRDKRSTP